MTNQFCEDEGCPHSGTKHTCVSPLTPSGLKLNERYNWKGQPERLIYLGKHQDHRLCRGWYQFAKVDSPSSVWCEVRAEDLSMMEATHD